MAVSRASHVEAQARTDFGLVALVNEQFVGPIDAVAIGNVHHLQMSMLPIPGTPRICFLERWQASRLEVMGSIFLVPANSSIRSVSDCKEQRSLVCRLDPTRVSEWIGGEMEWTDRHLVGSLNIASISIRRLLQAIADELKGQSFASGAMIELLSGQLCIELARYYRGLNATATSGGLSPWRLLAIERYVDANLETANISEIARLCGLSVRHMSRSFQETCGKPIGRYVAERKLAAARALLIEGESVKYAAFATGFSAPSNFTTAFRKAMGCSPSQFQKSWRRNAGASTIQAKLACS